MCCPGHMETSTGSAQDNLLIVEYPFQRMVSLDCAILHSKPEHYGGQASIELCFQCVTSLNSDQDTVEENCMTNTKEEKCDTDMVEIEVEAKNHDLITIEEDETTYPDEDITEKTIDVPITEAIEDSTFFEHLNDKNC